MTAFVCVGGLDIPRSLYKRLIRLTPRQGTTLIPRSRHRACRRQHGRHTIYSQIIEFVRHEGLKAVLHGIDPSKPCQPRTHSLGRNEIAGVRDEGLDCDTGEAGGDVEGGAEGTGGAEEGVHAKRDSKEDEPGDEELTGCSLKIAHEVHDNVKYRDLGES